MAIISPRATSSYPGVRIDHHDGGEHRREIAEKVNSINQGKINVVSTITLTINVASTTLNDTRIGANSIIVLVPTTANASAEIGNGTIYLTYPNATEKQAVINHANNAQADRTFVYAVLG